MGPAAIDEMRSAGYVVLLLASGWSVTWWVHKRESASRFAIPAGLLVSLLVGAALDFVEGGSTVLDSFVNAFSSPYWRVVIVPGIVAAGATLYSRKRSGCRYIGVGLLAAGIGWLILLLVSLLVVRPAGW
ncbi:MAG: hypothetical protein U1E26_09210 [Coriobacteriia bacterium]|nr:hypothetical protein [Coriobacteriia bacterium]